MNSAELQPLLDVGLLGGFRLSAGGKPVKGVRSPRTQALLVYLLLHRNTPHPRHHLAFLLWPDSAERQARTNLRHLLHDLRHALPEADRLLHIDAQEIRWETEAAVSLDVSHFEAHLGDARRAEEEGSIPHAIEHLERAVRLYHGDLHPACYEPWLEPERSRLRDGYLGGLERLVQLLTQQEAIPQAIHYATQLVQRNPLREQGYLALMRLHEARGDHGDVLRVYHQCRATFARELHVEPGPDLRTLFRRARRATSSPPATVPFASSSGTDHPLVGRETALTQIESCWTRVTSGCAHLVLITGDPGIGKTRLAEEVLFRAQARGVPTARSRSHEAEGRLAWAPVVGWLRSPALRDGVHTLDSAWLRELSRILPELRPERPDPRSAGATSTGWGRRNFLEAVDRAILAAPPPLVLLLDDIQWTDPGTLDWIGHLMRSEVRSPILFLATMRTEAPPDDEPVTHLLLELEARTQLTRVALEPLDLEETTTLAHHLFGSAVEGGLAHRLHRETEGNPLFIVETLRSGVLDDLAGKDPDHPVPTPVPVQNVIAHRLGKIPPRARDVVRCMAVIGRSCPIDILARASTCPEDELVDALDDLWHRRIVREQEGGRYDFTHDKIRSVALAGIPPARRRQLHRRVAEALTALRGSTPETIASQVATHWEHAGMIEPAIASYELAAEDARRRFAEREAVGHARRALELCATLPADLDRASRQARLNVLMGVASVSLRGWAAPETGEAFREAARIGSQLDERDHHFHGLWGLHDFHFVRGEFREATEADQAMWILAEEKDRSDWRAVTRQIMNMNTFHAGHIAEAALVQREIEVDLLGDLGTMGEVRALLHHTYGSHLSWHCGHSERALTESRAVLALVEPGANPMALGIALAYEAMLRQFRREAPETLQTAEAALALCEQHEVPYYRAWATFLLGWARAVTGLRSAGIAEMELALRGLESTGTGLRMPYYLGLLAEGYLLDGSAPRAGDMVDSALEMGRRTGERWCEPELLRLRGVILQAQGHSDEAEASLREGLSLAHRQGSLGPELRLATTLAGLLKKQNRNEDARTLLQGVFDRFTEGWDTPDLVDAATVLATLRTDSQDPRPKATGGAVPPQCPVD